MPATAPCIVVGYDGSPASRAAVELAANRARAGGCVVVVHAFHVPPDWYGWPDYARLLAEPERHGQQLLESVEEEVPALTEVPHETELVGDRQARAIEKIAETRDADEIVIGTRGFGPGRAVLGSVAHELLHIAQRPVTAVPERTLRTNTEDDRGEARMATNGAGPRVAS